MVSKIVNFINDLSEKQILLILLGITFGLRLYAVLMAKGIAIDGTFYGFMARDFLKGNFIKGLSLAYHPFYPLLISWVSPDVSHVEIAGRLISFIFGTITLIPVYYFVKGTLGQKEAYFSGLFYCFHPYLVTYSGMLLSEATYWGLLTFSVYFFWRGISQKSVLGCAISGACLGLSYLTKPEGIGYLVVFFAWMIIGGEIKKGWFKRCLMMGSLIVGFLIFAFPYLFALRQETGQWLISKKGMATQAQVMKWVEVNEVPKNKATKNEGLQDFRKEDLKSEKMIEQPRQSIKYFNLIRMGKFILQFFPFTLYHYFRAFHFALWLFLFWGLIRRRGKEIRGELFLASLVFFHLISLSTFTKSTIRFSVPLIPISLFWAGAGILEMRKYLSKRNVTNPGNWVFFLLVLSFLVQLPQSLRPERRHRADQKDVGIWLKENTPKDAVIMSNSPVEIFYGDREFVLLPPGINVDLVAGKSYQEIIQLARQKRIKYILVNKNTREFNPDFEVSIEERDLRELYRYRGKDGDMTVVYEVIN